MSGISNSTGAASGIVGTTVGTPAGGTQTLLNTYTADNTSGILAVRDFSTTYTTYKVVIDGLKPATNSIHFYFFLTLLSDATVRSSGYRGSSNYSYSSSSSAGNSQVAFGDTLFGTLSDISSHTHDTFSGVFYVFQPATAGNSTMGVGTMTYQDDAGAEITSVNAGRYLTAEAHGGFNISAEAGNWTSGQVKVFGQN